MPKRKTTIPNQPPAGPSPPPIDVLLAAQAACDPRAWEAMLTLNKMRSAQRRQKRADNPQDETIRRD
ncbi:MAG: hypothetical protein RID42_04000 [Alphaproteobacteria bacterium]